MTESLACNSSDIFTAVASVSGCTELQPGMCVFVDDCAFSAFNSGTRVAHCDMRALLGLTSVLSELIASSPGITGDWLFGSTIPEF